MTSVSDRSEQGRRLAELERVAEQQAALRRIATLVAAGVSEPELVTAVVSEIGALFGAQRAATLRWDGDTIRMIGAWSAEGVEPRAGNEVLAYGGDTITARIVETGSPARIDSADDLQTEFARKRWAELGLQAAIGAPILVDGKVWGVVIASRTRKGDVFPAGVQHHLRDFAALVAQAIVNTEVRRETAALIAEQSALRRVATLVAAGRPKSEVLGAAMAEIESLFGTTSVMFVRWEGVPDEVVVVAASTAPGCEPVEPGSLYHPASGSPTLTVLETGAASRATETSPERGTVSVVAAPVIANAWLVGALTASRPAETPFPAGAEQPLRSFADLVAQSIANEQAQAELRASRARIVQTADETRRRLERNLHDGAQQRLVSVSLTLRLAASALRSSPGEAAELIASASEGLSVALGELRDLARGLHPTILTEAGLGLALDALAESSTLPVEVANEIDARLPEPVEAALYYLVSESLTNVARHAEATKVLVRARCRDRVAAVEVVDDGVGGAEIAGGSGIRGLADRVDALGGRFGVDSSPGHGTRIWAAIPFEPEPDEREEADLAAAQARR
ncbi:MAG TPA: GAF domain-containing protein [Gaiellaceae bacterium]|nr:GAF domain-containing protein [Gaiellaceae bacterium]